jgi:hypothetical protein
VYKCIIIINIIIITAFEFSLGGSSPYTSTDKTRINIHKQNKVQTIQNTVNTSTHVYRVVFKCTLENLYEFVQNDAVFAVYCSDVPLTTESITTLQPGYSLDSSTVTDYIRPLTDDRLTAPVTLPFHIHCDTSDTSAFSFCDWSGVGYDVNFVG